MSASVTPPGMHLPVRTWKGARTHRPDWIESRKETNVSVVESFPTIQGNCAVARSSSGVAVP